MEFEDGSHLGADVVVFATGFVGNMRIQAEEMFGPDIAAQLEDFWGLDPEGEINGAFKPLPRKYRDSSSLAPFLTHSLDRSRFLVSRRSHGPSQVLLPVHCPSN